MGVYRCNHCKFISEHIIHRSMPPTKCANCGQDVTVYETAPFIQHIIDRWASTVRELNALKNQDKEPAEQQQAQEHNQSNPLDNVKLSDTNILANIEQHQPLTDWFKNKQITPEFDCATIDMSGYFDEAAAKIGQNFAIFQDILNKIAWNYRNNHSGLNLDLKKYSQKEAQQINNICREFYSHTLFSRYTYQKQDKLIHLKLQAATPIRQFFNGTWLEWFALNEILTLAKQYGKNYNFSCARSAKIRFANEDLHELDVLFLPKNKQLIVIECKTGEYRQNLDKYLNLRKRLNIPTDNFILLVTNINEAQAKSLSSMYQLTFVTLTGLIEQLKKVM